MRSTERVRPGEVTTYEGLGDPRWKGRLCLRSGTSEYNVSFVADRLAKDGARGHRAHAARAGWRTTRRSSARTPTCSRRSPTATATWASPTPTTSGRELEEDPDFPVALVWADQQGRGTHVNLSGLGVVQGSDQAEDGHAS